MSSLGDQLKKLALPQVVERFNFDKLRKSFLFDKEKISKFDGNALLSIGRNGFDELLEVNKKDFIEFENLFESSTLRMENRLKLSKKENKKLDKKLNKLIIGLTDYFQEKYTHRIIEWLIYKFSIHYFNVDALITMSLSYHQTSLFIRLIQVIFPVDTKRQIEQKSFASLEYLQNWLWMNDLIADSQIIHRSLITKELINNRIFFEQFLQNFIGNIHRSPTIAKFVYVSIVSIIEELRGMTTEKTDYKMLTELTVHLMEKYENMMESEQNITDIKSIIYMNNFLQLINFHNKIKYGNIFKFYQEIILQTNEIDNHIIDYLSMFFLKAKWKIDNESSYCCFFHYLEENRKKKKTFESIKNLLNCLMENFSSNLLEMINEIKLETRKPFSSFLIHYSLRHLSSNHEVISNIMNDCMRWMKVDKNISIFIVTLIVENLTDDNLKIKTIEKLLHFGEQSSLECSEYFDKTIIIGKYDGKIRRMLLKMKKCLKYENLSEENELPIYLAINHQSIAIRQEAIRKILETFEEEEEYDLEEIIDIFKKNKSIFHQTVLRKSFVQNMKYSFLQKFHEKDLIFLFNQLIISCENDEKNVSQNEVSIIEKWLEKLKEENHELNESVLNFLLIQFNCYGNDDKIYSDENVKQMKFENDELKEFIKGPLIMIGKSERMIKIVRIIISDKEWMIDIFINMVDNEKMAMINFLREISKLIGKLIEIEETEILPLCTILTKQMEKHFIFRDLLEEILTNCITNKIYEKFIKDFVMSSLVVCEDIIPEYYYSIQLSIMDILINVGPWDCVEKNRILDYLFLLGATKKTSKEICRKFLLTIIKDSSENEALQLMVRSIRKESEPEKVMMDYMNFIRKHDSVDDKEIFRKIFHMSNNNIRLFKFFLQYIQQSKSKAITHLIFKYCEGQLDRLEDGENNILKYYAEEIRNKLRIIYLYLHHNILRNKHIIRKSQLASNYINKLITIHYNNSSIVNKSINEIDDTFQSNNSNDVNRLCRLDLYSLFADSPKLILSVNDENQFRLILLQAVDYIPGDTHFNTKKMMTLTPENLKRVFEKFFITSKIQLIEKVLYTTTFTLIHQHENSSVIQKEKDIFFLLNDYFPYLLKIFKRSIELKLSQPAINLIIRSIDIYSRAIFDLHVPNSEMLIRNKFGELLDGLMQFLIDKNFQNLQLEKSIINIVTTITANIPKIGIPRIMSITELLNDSLQTKELVYGSDHLTLDDFIDKIISSFPNIPDEIQKEFIQMLNVNLVSKMLLGDDTKIVNILFDKIVFHMNNPDFFFQIPIMIIVQITNTETKSLSQRLISLDNATNQFRQLMCNILSEFPSTRITDRMRNILNSITKFGKYFQTNFLNKEHKLSEKKDFVIDRSFANMKSLQIGKSNFRFAQVNLLKYVKRLLISLFENFSKEFEENRIINKILLENCITFFNVYLSHTLPESLNEESFQHSMSKLLLDITDKLSKKLNEENFIDFLRNHVFSPINQTKLKVIEFGLSAMMGREIEKHLLEELFPSLISIVTFSIENDGIKDENSLDVNYNTQLINGIRAAKIIRFNLQNIDWTKFLKKNFISQTTKLKVSGEKRKIDEDYEISLTYLQLIILSLNQINLTLIEFNEMKELKKNFEESSQLLRNGTNMKILLRKIENDEEESILFDYFLALISLLDDPQQRTTLDLNVSIKYLIQSIFNFLLILMRKNDKKRLEMGKMIFGKIIENNLICLTTYMKELIEMIIVLEYFHLLSNPPKNRDDEKDVDGKLERYFHQQNHVHGLMSGNNLVFNELTKNVPAHLLLPNLLQYFKLFISRLNEDNMICSMIIFGINTSIYFKPFENDNGIFKNNQIKDSFQIYDILVKQLEVISGTLLNQNGTSEFLCNSTLNLLEFSSDNFKIILKKYLLSPVEIIDSLMFVHMTENRLLRIFSESLLSVCEESFVELSQTFINWTNNNGDRIFPLTILSLYLSGMVQSLFSSYAFSFLDVIADHLSVEKLSKDKYKSINQLMIFNLFLSSLNSVCVFNNSNIWNMDNSTKYFQIILGKYNELMTGECYKKIITQNLWKSISGNVGKCLSNISISSNDQTIWKLSQDSIIEEMIKIRYSEENFMLNYIEMLEKFSSQFGSDYQFIINEAGIIIGELLENKNEKIEKRGKEMLESINEYCGIDYQSMLSSKKDL
ncbi:hypothetical protein SNEBB_010122 [Seison nebaliae]|nr:hypothetical protein SNEBB_010122 [Seison nebaliae]